jgi:hypothetical protein
MQRFHSRTFPPDYKNRAAVRALFKHHHPGSSRPAHLTRSKNRRRNKAARFARRAQRS